MVVKVDVVMLTQKCEYLRGDGSKGQKSTAEIFLTTLAIVWWTSLPYKIVWRGTDVDVLKNLDFEQPGEDLNLGFMFTLRLSGSSRSSPLLFSAFKFERSEEDPLWY